MVLLHWATLVPDGDSGLAAIRFTAPIRVSFLRVFPTGARPFAQHAPELVACTVPDAFFLDVFFNAHPTSPEAKDKQRAANALVPTSIAYAGGQVDFSVDMGAEYATRLMIVKGAFRSLSIAIYGETVLELPALIPSYERRPMLPVEPLPLSQAVDPSYMLDPTHVASQLLALIPDSPPLALVIRLMFCLKPSNDDWDLPDFPYLHADLETDDEAFNLDIALDRTAKPVRDDVSYDTLSAFATKVAEAVGPKSANQAYLVAKLLAISASQHPDMSRTLLQQMNFNAVFDARTMDDEVTLLRLLEAVANADIARHLSSTWFLDELDKLQASPTTEKYVKAVSRRVEARIRGWSVFEDALVNTTGNFHGAAQMLEDVGLDEQSIGIWLETMLTHPNIVDKLAAVPVPVDRQQLPAHLLRRRACHADITHKDFIAFTRAYVGVASVLGVWAWTDSLGNDDCRAQTLAIVRLWQNVDGYREIVNHLLLLRQLTRRLEWITTGNVLPRKSGILAEQILVDLTKDPHAILSEDVVQAILSLNPPLSFIAEHERLSMRKVALVADDGLPAAIEELTFTSSHPLSLRRLRTIRVSLAIVQRELADAESGEWMVLQAMWDENAHGFVERIVDMFVGVSTDLNTHFGLIHPPPRNEPLVEQLFQTADDLLRLITHVAPTLPMTSRALRNLTCSIADVFAYAETAGSRYSQASAAAADLRQTCLDLVSTLVQPGIQAEPQKPAAEVVIRALLEHGHGTLTRGRDPTGDFQQVLTLIDHILPHTRVDDDRWVAFILPKVLLEFGAYFRLLDPANKVYVINRVVKLDDGLVGIGEWLLMEEMKHLSQALEGLKQAASSRELEMATQHFVFLSLQFLSGLVSGSEWIMSTITSVPEVSKLLAGCLTALLDMHLVSPVLDDITRVLATRAETFEADLKFALVLTSLRAFRHEPRVLQGVLKELPWDPDQDSHYRELLRLEIGQTLAIMADARVTTKLAQTVLSILVWLTEQEDPKMATLCGISSSSLSQVLVKLEKTLPPSSATAFASMKTAIHVEEDDAMVPTAAELPSRLALTLQEFEGLFRPVHGALPSTPKGTAHTPDILGVLTSPTGLLRSPAATGLTKQYAGDSFRLLRQAPTARLNTSRLPSMHVDDFELVAGSPVLEGFQGQDQTLLQLN